MTPRASRSLIEPSGLNASSFANRFTPWGPSFAMRTMGVLPTVDRMWGWIRNGLPSSVGLLRVVYPFLRNRIANPDMRPDVRVVGWIAWNLRGPHEGNAMFLEQPEPSPDVEDLYRRDRAGSGFLMNLTRLWAWRPDVLQAFTAARSRLLSTSSLTPREQAVIVCAAVGAI